MDKNEYEPIDEEELQRADGEPLPDREAMSIITPTPDNDFWSIPEQPPPGT